MSDPDTRTAWRHDYLTGRRVIVAGNRGNRPGADSPRMKSEPLDRCPFCAGHEADSPVEISEHRLPDSPHAWDVRVVGNLYPALQKHTPEGFGHHEVIIESAGHEAQFANLSVEHIALAIRVWHNRLRAAALVPDIRYAALFKNNGPSAGASLEHCHTQMLAMGFVPEAVGGEMRRCREYYSRCGRLYFDDWWVRVWQEDLGSRRVDALHRVVAFCPEVSRSAYEVVILPTKKTPSFVDIDELTIDELAYLLRRVLRALGRGLNEPDYNLIVYQAPFDETAVAANYYSWRIEIAPRTTEDAGFELGTGCAINATPPERAAQQIREWLR